MGTYSHERYTKWIRINMRRIHHTNEDGYPYIYRYTVHKDPMISKTETGMKINNRQEDTGTGTDMRIYIPVLWIRIRIRNIPNVLAGSESEKKFGFGYRFGFRYLYL
jgi:hypothetical protein